MADLERFRAELLDQQRAFDSAAEQLKGFLEEALREARVFVHGVVVRVKDVGSAVRKLDDKGYADPWVEMTDIVGARIFLYFRSDALHVEEVLRKYFDVDEANSSNKIDDLEFNAFGYTSRHLICSVSEKTRDLRLASSKLQGMKFEVQIRSLLEHAWAEIEHELVYKAGTKPPKDVRRRFAASSASLEIVEREFHSLREFELELATERISVLATSGAQPLDRAWFLAVLTDAFPDRPSWHPDSAQDVFFQGVELRALEFLKKAGVTTVRELQELVKGESVRGLVARYATSRGVESSGVSHLPVSLFACAVAGEGSLPDELNELMDEDATAVLSRAMSKGSA